MPPPLRRKIRSPQQAQRDAKVIRANREALDTARSSLVTVLQERFRQASYEDMKKAIKHERFKQIYAAVRGSQPVYIMDSVPPDAFAVDFAAVEARSFTALQMPVQIGRTASAMERFRDTLRQAMEAGQHLRPALEPFIAQPAPEPECDHDWEPYMRQRFSPRDARGRHRGGPPQQNGAPQRRCRNCGRIENGNA